jgi:hypothetical protein
MPAMIHSCVALEPELREWQRNYFLNPVTTFSLFDEFMEMSVWGQRAGRDRVGSSPDPW